MTNFPRLLWYLANGQRRLYWGKEKLRAFQEKRLRSIIKNAYDFVPFYHEKFRKANLLPSDIKHLDDLPKLPLVKKEELKQESTRRLISSSFDMADLKIVRTSGSTGQPLLIFLSRAEDDWRKSNYMRANISCGQKPRDSWVVLVHPSHFSDTTDLQRRLGIFAQTCISLYTKVSKQLILVDEAQPDVLDGYSGSLALLAREAQREGRGSIRPRLIFGTAEGIDSSSMRFIEHVFGAPYLDQFGCTELDRTAWMCPCKTGYHLDIDSVITEFVDDDGKNVSSGERGEIVYTSLFNYAMPLIRYAVGDMGVPSNEACPCGRQLPLMKTGEGRKSSFMRLSDGKLVSPLIIEGIMNYFPLFSQIEQYRMVQKKADFFEIMIELHDTRTDKHAFKDALIKYVVTQLNQLVPESKLSEAHFDVEFVERIPIDKSGKRRAIYSEVSYR